MIFHGAKLGVTFYPGGKIQWFTSRNDAHAAEQIEIAKFAVADRAKETRRLQRLGLQAEPPPAYSISLAEQQSGQRKQRRLS